MPYLPNKFMDCREKMNKNTGSEEIRFLVQTALEDSVIKQRILELLQLNSFERRSSLNIWLEQLRLRNASEELLYVLSCLFDDAVAQKTLSLIKKSK
jgi:hypothetical protein